MAVSVDIGTKSEGYASAVYARKPDDYQIKYHTYYMHIDEEQNVSDTDELRRRLKMAEKAERENKKKKERQARALKNLERLAKGDDDAAFDAARYLYELC